MPNECEGGKALCSVLQTDIKSLVGFSARFGEAEKLLLLLRFFFFLLLVGEIP